MDNEALVFRNQIIMNTQYYFLMPADTNGPTSVVASQLVRYVKGNYTNCLVSAERMDEVVNDLKELADELRGKRGNHTKIPVIVFIDDQELRTAYLRIDGWPIYCEKAMRQLI